MSNTFTNIYRINKEFYSYNFVFKPFYHEENREEYFFLTNLKKKLIAFEKLYTFFWKIRIAILFVSVYSLVLTIITSVIASLSLVNNSYDWFYLMLYIPFSVLMITYIIYLVKLSKNIFLKEEMDKLNWTLYKILISTKTLPPFQLTDQLKSFWRVNSIWDFNVQLNTLFYIIYSWTDSKYDS